VLSREKLSDIFRAGYCIATVRFAQNTDDNPAGARQRLHYLQLHITNEHCEDCDFANRLKALEAVVAQRMGAKAYALFLHGGDITKVTGRDETTYEKTLVQVIDAAITAGIIPERMRNWMATVSERQDFEAETKP
jgi:hypothetical protein